MRVAVAPPRALVALVAMLAVAGCGADSQPQPPSPSPSKPAAPGPASPVAPKLRPRATAGGVVLTRDPEAGNSFPLPAGTRGATNAPRPGDAPDAPRRKVRTPAAGSDISPGAP